MGEIMSANRSSRFVRHGRLPLVLSFAVVVPLAVLLWGSMSTLPQADELRWPLQLRYEIRHFEGDRLTASELHEFRGAGWNDWTDVVLDGHGDSDDRAQVGRVQRVADGVYTSGWLTEQPRDVNDEFLGAEFFASFPGNAMHVEESRVQEGDELLSPNDMFNGGFGHEVERRSTIRSEPGSREDEERVADALSLERSAVRSSRRVIAACEAGTVAACGDEGSAVVDFVFHAESRIPLEVRRVMPDGTATEMLVTRVR